MRLPKNGAPDRGLNARRLTPLRLLAATLLFESAVFAVGASYFVVQIVVSPADSRVSAIGVVVLAIIGCAALATIAIATLRGRAWIRGAAITVQILQLIVAVGDFQNSVGRADIGLLLGIPAILALILLFTRSVMAATTNRER